MNTCVFVINEKLQHQRLYVLTEALYVSGFSHNTKGGDRLAWQSETWKHLGKSVQPIIRKAALQNPCTNAYQEITQKSFYILQIGCETFQIKLKVENGFGDGKWDKMIAREYVRVIYIFEDYDLIISLKSDNFAAHSGKEQSTYGKTA